MRGVSPGDKMMFYPGVWLLINCLYGLTTGYCLYGDDPKCAFQCHCAVDRECSGDTCPSGCDTAPLGHNWRGPACQIGNVGLHKPANMTAGSYNQLYPPTAALDGVSPGVTNANCAHPVAHGNNSPEWWTDLVDVYKIYNITIYGSNDPKLQQFELTVYNTSDSEVLCGYHPDPVLKHSTITCTEPVIGRYVHFKKTGGREITWTPICEVVIIGHKYIDCSDCPAGVTCNDVTGCTQCSGSYPPDCKTKCESGYYGTNCQQHCGHCMDGAACDIQNGRCYKGCQIWWAEDRCDKYIERANGTEKSISVKQKTESSIEIEWQHLTGITDALKQYYGYLVQYKEETSETSYREAATVNYTSSPILKIEKLECYTSYFIQIKPFRMFDNQIDYGSAYSVLQVNTNCCDSSPLPIYMMALIIVILVITNITLSIMLWKSRRQQEKHKSSNIFLDSGGGTDSQPDQRTRDADVQIELSTETAEYEFIPQNTPSNQHNQTATPVIHKRNDGIAQYEDIEGMIAMETSQNTYEGFSDKARAVYENRTVTGPYAELKKVNKASEEKVISGTFEEQI